MRNISSGAQSFLWESVQVPEKKKKKNIIYARRRDVPLQTFRRPCDEGGARVPLRAWIFSSGQTKVPADFLFSFMSFVHAPPLTLPRGEANVSFPHTRSKSSGKYVPGICAHGQWQTTFEDGVLFFFIFYCDCSRPWTVEKPLRDLTSSPRLNISSKCILKNRRYCFDQRGSYGRLGRIRVRKHRV